MEGPSLSASQMGRYLKEILKWSVTSFEVFKMKISEQDKSRLIRVLRRAAQSRAECLILSRRRLAWCWACASKKSQSAANNSTKEKRELRRSAKKYCLIERTSSASLPLKMHEKFPHKASSQLFKLPACSAREPCTRAMLARHSGWYTTNTALQIRTAINTVHASKNYV